MSARPGYEELVAERGHEAADRIIHSAEVYSDNGHVDWPEALAWAIEYHDRPPDPELEAKQARNNAAWRDIERRRGDAARLILYVSLGLGGGVDDAPERLAQAEAIHDAEAWRLGPNASMREQLDWAKEQAQRALGSDG